MNNERQAHAALCPPCDSQCNQGRLCAAPPKGRVRPPQTARRRLAAGLFLALCLVACAYVLVTLLEMGWRAL